MPVNTFFSAVTSKDAPDGRHLPSVRTRKAAGRPNSASAYGAAEYITFASLLALLIVCLVMAGCGSSGYAGAGVTGLSRSAITIDAGQSYPVTATLSGESALVSWTLAGDTCSGSSCGSISSQTGSQVTYTAPAGITSQMKLTLTAGVSGTSNASKTSITVNPDPVISGTAPAGTVGTPYSVALKTTGGTAPLKWSMSGTLPEGLAFNTSTATISGTPTTVGNTSFVAQIVDSSDVPYTVTASQTIAISTSGGGGGGGSTTPLTITGNPPAGKLGVPYTATLTAAGGVPPYNWSLAAGTLPAGLTLTGAGSSGIISGTPTATGTSMFTAQAEDSAGTKATAALSITIASANSGSLTIMSPPSGTVGTPYTGAVGVTGGTAPYNCVLVSGTMPAGLTFIPTCAITGTPTAAGTSSLVVTATDASNPVLTKTGPVTLTIASGSISLNLSTLPGATIGVPYSATIGVSGGTAPYSCVQAGGTLPNGLALAANCVVSGTPTVVGPFNFNVKATDTSSPVETTTGPESITVSPTPLTITATNLPDATVGTAYTATIPVSGGTAPYNCAILAGTLPAGLSNAGCVVSGTPTVAGSVSLTVKATDASSPMESYTGPVGLKVLPASITLVISSPPAGTTGAPYSGTIGVTGGTAPYSCTLVSGTLPTGYTLSGCVISGTTTQNGSFPITVKATDNSNPTATKTGPVTVTVNPATTTLTLTSPPDAVVSVPYTGTIGVSGGTAPYACTLASGTLPAGLTLGSNCVVTGTPTAIGSSTIMVHATDAATPQDATTGPVTINVTAVPKLTLTGSLPNATLGVPYTQTLTAQGGITPYTYSLTAGTLPAGINLASDGTISGTPTAVGASSFTVTVTDTETTPQTASLPLVLLVVYPTTPTDAELVGPYAFLFQGYDDTILGVLSYQTAFVGSMTADGTGVISAGEQDANHQTSNPTGNTISSQDFLGTYTLAADNTGSLTLTTLNADGTTDTTSTYAITVKAPVSPATVATTATFIESDSGGLSGTRGSASMLAQTASSFTAGLNGSYAFGMSGDTPCVPACTVGLVAGPVASVGQLKTDGAGNIASGSSDANDATTNYANKALTGTYSAADDNGRLDLAMTTAGTPAATYPVDYAVYLVDAGHAFVMSTDKHSSFDLLAGDAQLQTQATFSNASLSGPFIGYENAQSNPGLLGTTLQNTLSLSTATIFRATGASNGTCDTTNIDSGGLNSLVTGLTGLGSSVPVLNALLGTYQSTGNSSCTVAANGRGVLNYPAPGTLLTPILQLLGLSTAPPAPRELYLVSPNSGYFLETGYAGLGKFEAQTGAPFSLATLDGTYLYTSLPAASVASITSSGTLVANGTGSATTTLDTSVLAGNLNALTLGQTNTSTYALTDATAGRYTLGTDVIYAISPTRFVLVDTSAVATSPTVSLLY